MLDNKHRCVVLAGIGGVGKSQIAIEYCYRYRVKSPDAHIFWVHASNNGRFIKSYKDIARELDLPGLDTPKVDSLQLVFKWFNKDADAPWLLILDNADDSKILFGSDSCTSSRHDEQHLMRPTVSYLPRSGNGAVIVTTRDILVGDRLADWERLEERTKPIVVLSFGVDDAKHLLQSKLTKVDEWNEAEAATL